MGNEDFRELLLGDPHNFGQCVRYSDREFKNIYKPRPIFWERLFLSQDSNLRRYLDRCFKIEAVTSPFHLIPNIAFSENHEGQMKCGTVQRLEWKPDLSLFSEEPNIEKLGSTIGLLFYFGICDLHQENVAFGRISDKPIFCPLDIECIFNDLSLVSQSGLIPKGGLDNPNHGLRLLEELNIELNVAAISHGFIRCIQLLNGYQNKIMALLRQEHIFSDLPIRLVLKPTSYYRELLSQSKTWSEADLFWEEIDQLKRGDIPYFFRKIDSRRVYYYVKPGEQKEVGSEKEVIRNISQLFFVGSENKAKYVLNQDLKSSVLQLVRFLLSQKSKGEYQYLETVVQFDDGFIRLNAANCDVRVACGR